MQPGFVNPGRIDRAHTRPRVKWRGIDDLAFVAILLCAEWWAVLSLQKSN